ncbi:hypothetical protein [Actinomadura chokoriensis]|uniref:hypothetical protein n=1 Tax=Actinomadura chokoriensis TaxID=454156 RepID=UPI0031F84A1F
MDGSLITAARLGAGLCLYVTLGGGTPRDDHPIEFVPTAEAATALRRTLLDEGGAAFEAPCRVGLRLRDA